MILDSATKSLELILGSAVTTNAMPITVDYVDLTTTTTLAGSSDTQSNGITAVTILAAPAASTQRKVNALTVFNADTASKVVTIRLNNNTTLRNLISVTLQVGDTIGYSDTDGWYLIDSSGQRKMSMPGYALLAGSASQAFSCSTLTPATGIVGKSDGSSAGAGDLGEIISSTIASGSAVSLTSGTVATITTITLTPGRWLVSAEGFFLPDGSTSITVFGAAINTAASFPGANRFNFAAAAFVPAAGAGFGGPTGHYYTTVAINTTIYFVARATFTAGTLGAFGTIIANRI